MVVSNTVWTATIASFLGMFILEFFIVEMRKHKFGHKEAIAWIVFYLIAAATFGAYIWFTYGHLFGQQFFAGYLTE